LPLIYSFSTAQKGILPLVCSFFTRRGEKRTYKNVKYRVAAGESCLLRKS
jgi:hypothetical protein